MRISFDSGSVVQRWSALRSRLVPPRPRPLAPDRRQHRPLPFLLRALLPRQPFTGLAKVDRRVARDVYGALSEGMNFDLQYMAALALAKLASSIAAALFGVFGVLGETRDSEGRLTRWGRVAIVGVLVSCLLAIVSLRLEQSEEQRKAENDKQRRSEDLRIQQQNLGTQTKILDQARGLADSLSVTTGLQTEALNVLRHSEDQQRAIASDLEKSVTSQRDLLSGQERVARDMRRSLHPLKPFAFVVAFVYRFDDPTVSNYVARLRRYVEAWVKTPEAREEMAHHWGVSGHISTDVANSATVYSRALANGEYEPMLLRIEGPDSPLFPDSNDWLTRCALNDVELFVSVFSGASEPADVQGRDSGDLIFRALAWTAHSGCVPPEERGKFSGETKIWLEIDFGARVLGQSVFTTNIKRQFDNGSVVGVPDLERSLLRVWVIRQSDISTGDLSLFVFQFGDEGSQEFRVEGFEKRLERSATRFYRHMSKVSLE